MDHQLRALRRRIGRTERDARGHRRYDEELRIAIIEYARRREDDGCSRVRCIRPAGIGVVFGENPRRCTQIANYQQVGPRFSSETLASPDASTASRACDHGHLRTST